MGTARFICVCFNTVFCVVTFSWPFCFVWPPFGLDLPQKRASYDGLHRSVAERSYPSPKVRAGGREEQPRVQRVVAAWAQEGREELLHVQGQEGSP